jgi:VWFA-related protein
VRRIQLLSAALIATTLLTDAQSQQMREGGPPAEARSYPAREDGQTQRPEKRAPADPPPPPASQQPPVFRGGTNLVQIDAIVTDDNRRPVTDLTATDFELLDDGKPVAIDRVRFLGAAEYPADATPAPIRTHEDEEREASRDDVRVYAIVLDDYHVPRMGELRVIEPLLAFVRQLPPTDLVAVYYPLDSVTDVAFSRDRGPVVRAIQAFYGRLGDYTPRHPVEEEHYKRQREIPRIRRQIVLTALQGLAAHLGGIKQGRKSIIFVSEAFTVPVTDMQDVYEVASRANVAIYPLDPRGLSPDRRVDRGPTPEEVMAAVTPAREFMRVVAAETGGRPIFANDVTGALGQVIRDSRAYYLITYESPHPDDGKFHGVTVRAKRRGATVFARRGYWAYKRGENTVAPAATLAAVPPAVKAAVDQLADSLRPDADEPVNARRRILMPPVDGAPSTAALAAPTIAVARGRFVGEPVTRREFHRTDTLVIRGGAKGTPTVSGRLLDRRGQPLTDLPVATADAPEIRVALGSLGPGDYVVELTARSGDVAAQQFVAFRLVR